MNVSHAIFGLFLLGLAVGSLALIGTLIDALKVFAAGRFDEDTLPPDYSPDELNELAKHPTLIRWVSGGRLLFGVVLLLGDAAMIVWLLLKWLGP